MQTIFKYFLTFSLLLTLNGCNTDALEDAMVSFDKAFIPVFYYTYTNDLDSAERAMLVLDSKWKKLYTQFEQQAANSHNWRESFQMVTAWLDEANCAIENRDADLALIQFDHARYELIDLRWREGMTYYLDKVWDLEAAIDIAVQNSRVSVLEIQDWQTFMPMVYDVEAAWDQVFYATWKKSHFDFDASEAMEEANRKLALGFAIKNFTIAVDYLDKCDIEDAAKEMEVAYLEYMFFFGDFDATRVIYAVK